MTFSRQSHLDHLHLDLPLLFALDRVRATSSHWTRALTMHTEAAHDDQDKAHCTFH
jgi:hypothetical protein